MWTRIAIAMGFGLVTVGPDAFEQARGAIRSGL
jgi:hypothetical protein